jgi:hypothetical protein
MTTSNFSRRRQTFSRTLEEWVNKQRKFVLEQGRQAMEARAESLLENAFRRNDMNDAAGVQKAQQQKAFQSITEGLTGCKEIASSLNTRSRKLVSALTGLSETIQKDTEEKQKVDSVVLIHVLQDIEKELRRSLTETADNLEKLENAW